MEELIEYMYSQDNDTYKMFAEILESTEKIKNEILKGEKE